RADTGPDRLPAPPLPRAGLRARETAPVLPALRALDDALLRAAEAFDRGEGAGHGLLGRSEGAGHGLFRRGGGAGRGLLGRSEGAYRGLFDRGEGAGRGLFGWGEGGGHGLLGRSAGTHRGLSGRGEKAGRGMPGRDGDAGRRLLGRGGGAGRGLSGGGEHAGRRLFGRRRSPRQALGAALGAGGREYGLRVALCFGASVAIAQALHHARWYGQHAHWYWLPATAVFLVKPDLGPLASRVLCRAAGTVLGALVFAGLAALLPRPAGLIALVAVCGALIPVATRHFAALTAVVTVLVLALLMAGGEPQASAGRIGETLLACALVLVVGHLPMPGKRGGGVRDRLAAAGGAAHAYLLHVLGTPRNQHTVESGGRAERWTLSAVPADRAERWALRREAYRTLAEARTAISLAAAELPALARHTEGTDAVAEALERLVDTTTACAVHLDDTGRLTSRHLRRLREALGELERLEQLGQRGVRLPLPTAA
ncbi:FUSC family protein, partial [Streptomyces nogalater]